MRQTFENAAQESFRVLTVLDCADDFLDIFAKGSRLGFSSDVDFSGGITCCDVLQAVRLGEVVETALRVGVGR
jgi:hypothetical protein